MKTKWIQSKKFKGVRWRQHPTRKHGVQFDRYFSIRYQDDGERVEEALGWASDAEKWTEEKAALKLAELKAALRSGDGPARLSEERRMAKEKREAEEAERERQEEERLQQERDEITFSKFYQDTYSPLAKQNKKPDTWRTEEVHFHKWIAPVIGNKPMKSVSPLDLERIKKNMADKKKAPRSIQYCLATVRQVFNVARSLSVFQGENPTSKVKKPKVDNRRVRFLSHEEASRLFADLATKSQQTHDVALLSLHCGLRAGEIFNLTWQDLDLERGQILVKDGKNSMGGRSRTAYMTTQVKEMLERRSAHKENALVFHNAKGGRILEPSNLFSRTVKELGFNDGVTDRRQKVVFHTLRHTFASWLVEAGTDLYTVKELLGQQSISMTERYSHLGANSLKRAVSAFEKAMQNSEKVVSLSDARGTAKE